MTCSLHAMDLRLLKIVISAIQGGAMPDLREEALRRRQRDILINWSRKLVKAATPLRDTVSPDDWLLFTQLRPFFITTEDPEQVEVLIDRLFGARSLEEVLNFFREEVARLDPEQADAVVEVAQQDKAPGLLDIQGVDAIENNLRAYLLHERRTLEELAVAATRGDVAPERLQDAGRRLTWRTCHILANLHPSWCLRTVSLTSLAMREELGLQALVADPRGMYAQLAQKVSGLYDQLPMRLEDEPQTGLCIAPRAVPQALELLDRWPVQSEEIDEQPAPCEIKALREALLYARRLNAGVWEVGGMMSLAEGVVPIILADQADREERPEKYVVQETPVEPPPFADELTQGDALGASKPSSQEEYLRRFEATAPVGEDNAAPAAGEKKAWWKKLMKK